MPRLVYRDPNGAEVVLGLRDKDVTLGRQADCEFVVGSPSTSRKHARVARRGAKWIISDLGSSHGTQVNGRPLKGEQELYVGDEIRLGDAVVQFEEGPAPAARANDAIGSIGPRRASPTTLGAKLTEMTSDMEKPSAEKVPAGKGAAPSRPSMLRRSGEILAATQLDAGDMMRAMERARRTDIREKASGETGTLLALVRVSDELRNCADEAGVCETTARMALSVTGGSRAFLAVKPEGGAEFEPRVAFDGSRRMKAEEFMISTTFVDKVVADRVALLAMDTDEDTSLSGAASVVAVGIRSILCVPLWDGKEILGYLYLDSLQGKGKQFRSGDVDFVTAIGHQAAAEIRRLRLAERVRSEEARRKDLARFVSGDVIRHIEKEAKAGRLDPTRSMQELLCTILFADLVGFTRIAEEKPPTEVKRLLDEYLAYMTEILVDKHGGTLDKFMGDGIMALYGAPFSRGPSEDARAACAAALDMRDTLDLLRKMRPEFKALEVRIGINSGKVVAGMIGTQRRLEYSVIGDAVNVASRLEALSDPGRILIGHTTYQVVRNAFECEFAGEKTLRNRETPVKAYWLEHRRDGTSDA